MVRLVRDVVSYSVFTLFSWDDIEERSEIRAQAKGAIQLQDAHGGVDETDHEGKA